MKQDPRQLDGREEEILRDLIRELSNAVLGWHLKYGGEAEVPLHMLI